jgi:hypothetical protein
MNILFIIFIIYLIYILFSMTENYRSNYNLSPISGGEPDYEPEIWNDDNDIQYSHNCYSYFLNDINQNLKCLCKNGKCKYINPQPGHYSRNIEVNLDNTTCDIIENRLLDDNINIHVADFDQKCAPNYYKGALTVDPNYQYHFYRQDSNGFWSHKDGGLPVTNLDASNKIISDPKLADKNYPDKKKPVNYSDFCNYYCIPSNQHTNTFMGRRNPKNKNLKYKTHDNDNNLELKCF